MTEQEKIRQRRAAQLLNMKIADAIAKGNKVLEVEPGYYRVGAYSVERIEVHGAKDFVLNGNGAYIIQETEGGGMLDIRNSSNTVVKGFKLDSVPLPFTQGTITAIDSESRKLNIKIDSGYHVPDAEWIKSNAIFYNSLGDTQLFGKWNETIIDIETLDERNIRIQPISKIIFHRELGLQVGDRVVIPRRKGYSALVIYDCELCVFQNIEIYSSGGFGIEEHGGKGGNLYKQVKITRKPGTNRLHSVSADGFHSIQVEKGPILLDCEIAYSQDDLINIHGFMNLVYEVVEDTRLNMIVMGHLNFDIGTEMKFYDLDTIKYVGSAKVVSYEMIDDPEYEQKVEMIRDDIRKRLKLYMRNFRCGKMYSVTLDKAVNVGTWSMVVTPNYGAKDARVENCYLHDGCVRGILMRSVNGCIKNNIFERIAGPAIYINAERNWLEGPFPYGTKIENNKIDKCAVSEMALEYIPGSIVVAMSSLGGKRESFNEILYKDITISRNIITNSGSCGIFTTNLRDSRICDNIIQNPWTSSYGKYEKAGRQQCIDNPFYGIYVDIAENITVVGNKIEGLPDWAKEIKVQDSDI